MRVECRAGYRDEQEPSAFWLGERRLAVVEIMDRWIGSDHRYIKLLAEDENFYILRHDRPTGEWSLGAFTRRAQ